MSIVNRHDVKVVLPRTGADPFWRRLLDEFAGDDDLRWKYLAMLALRESGWSMDEIGRVFRHNKGHVSRALKRIKQQIRERYRCEVERRAA